jgi:cytochrome c-type biogenesis protein CcmH
MILAAITLALLAASPPAVSPPAGVPLSGAALDSRTEQVGALLRCPVCQGLSVADSPSTMARNMKQEVREKLAAGYDQDQILASFEQSYGEFVRLRPPLRGANWAVWLGPVVFLLAGGALVAAALRGSRRPPQAAAAEHGGLPDDPRLAQAVHRVRALAYGSLEGTPRKTGSPR